MSLVRENVQDYPRPPALEPVADRLDGEMKLAVYRIVQEALSNVLRHAGAERIGVRVLGRDGRVVAEVEDDGAGFDVPESVEGIDRGLGLLGMQERASLAGGRLEIESEPGRGTTIRLLVPAPEETTNDG